MSDLILLDSVTKPEDCERRNALTGLDQPAIRFIPEKAATGSTKMLEIELRLNPSQKSFDNTVKRKIPIFAQGSLETLLRWKQDVIDVIQRKPCSNPQSKFDMTELLLGGDPQATWREVARDTCEAVLEVTGTAKGKTDQTFKDSLEAFMGHYFPKTGNPARKQKRYLTRSLFKPKGLRVSQVVTRLKTINRCLTLFPGPDNTELSEGTLVDILVQMCPRGWAIEMARNQFDPADHTLLEVQTELERSEIIEDITDSKHKAYDKKHKKRSNDDSDESKSDKKSSKKRKKDYKNSFKSKKSHGGDKPPCQYCTFFGGNAETHASTKCFHKEKIDKIWKANLDRNKGGYKKNELNKLVAKKVKESMKKSLKKNELSYSSTESDSST